MLGVLFAGTLVAQAAISADEAYANAIGFMQALPEPARVQYSIALTASNGSFLLEENPGGGDAEVGFSIGGDEVETSRVQAVARSGDAATTITFVDGASAPTTYRVFNALWPAAYDWLRYGIAATHPVSSPAPLEVSSSPAPSPLSAPLGVIAQVSAFDPGRYRVTDAGNVPCENGDRGRALTLVARSDPDDHALTQAVVDLDSGAICGLRLRLRPSTIVASGYAELQYRPYPPYQFLSREHISFVSHMRQVGPKPVTIDAAFSGFQVLARI